MGCFNTCSSCEEQRENCCCQHQRQSVSIHAPLARSNWVETPILTVCGFKRFNTCSSCEEQLAVCSRVAGKQAVSIHAPLARSNICAIANTKKTLCFNTCSSCEEQLEVKEGTRINSVSIHAPLARSNSPFESIVSRKIKFQYMLLLRGATLCDHCGERLKQVSIHAPLARSNRICGKSYGYIAVSIHAPLARSN